jgi:hypothetical protein
MQLYVNEQEELTVNRQTILARQSSDNNDGFITFQLHTADVVKIGDETIQSAWKPHEITLTNEVYAIICHRSGMTPAELDELGDTYTRKFLMQLVNLCENPPDREERIAIGLPVPPLHDELPIEPPN